MLHPIVMGAKLLEMRQLRINDGCELDNYCNL